LLFDSLITGFFLHDYVVRGIFYIKSAELRFLDLFTSRNDGLLLWVQQTPIDQVTYRQLAALSWDIGETIRLPLTIISLGLIVFLYLQYIHYTMKKNLLSLF